MTVPKSVYHVGIPDASSCNILPDYAQPCRPATRAALYMYVQRCFVSKTSNILSKAYTIECTQTYPVIS